MATRGRGDKPSGGEWVRKSILHRRRAVATLRKSPGDRHLLGEFEARFAPLAHVDARHVYYGLIHRRSSCRKGVSLVARRASHFGNRRKVGDSNRPRRSPGAHPANALSPGRASRPPPSGWHVRPPVCPARLEGAIRRIPPCRPTPPVHGRQTGATSAQPYGKPRSPAAHRSLS